MKKAHRELYEEVGRCLSQNQLFPPSAEEAHNLVGHALDATHRQVRDKQVRPDQLSIQDVLG